MPKVSEGRNDQRYMTARQIQDTPEANHILSRNQQDLLLAALNSQAGKQGPEIKQEVDYRPARNTFSTSSTMNSTNGFAQFASPQDVELDNFDVDFTPELDFLDGDTSFDFENTDLGGDIIGGFPGSMADESGTGDLHEKRKSRDESGEDEEGDAKRQETQEGEKGAKKPGRKPLTSEPTTKRKAQNRAAQRAFRERKEKHLKDLEVKVNEMTKASEAEKQENGLLKAQVNRLQNELKEYRKRLSLNSSAVTRSPPLAASTGQHRSNSGVSNYGNLQFDFPKFGALSGSQTFGPQGFSISTSPASKQPDSATPPFVTESPGVYGSQSSFSRENSGARSMSPKNLQNNGSRVGSTSQMANVNPPFAAYSTNTNMHGFQDTLPQMNGSADALADLFSPSLLKAANVDSYFDSPQSAGANHDYTTGNGGESTAGLNRVFQFNSGSSSTSPSADSQSQWNANGTTNSSCGTSPEPLHSPANKDQSNDNFADANSQQSQLSGPSQTSNFNTGFPTTSNTGFNVGNMNYGLPAMGGFDPVLFGDYRESQDAIVGAGDFSNGFFDDALTTAPFDFGSPSNLFGILQSPQQSQASLGHTPVVPAPSKSLMAEVEKNREGGDDDYGLPSQVKNEEKKMISCNNIWAQLQSNTDFQEGKFDLDGLCSELRVKARCSESGVMVDQDHVNAALRKLGKKEEKMPADMPSLVFEEASWDDIVKRMGSGGGRA